MMKTRLSAVAASLLFASALAAPASAVTLVQDSGWQYMSFGDVGSQISPSFEFTVVGNATLKITDAFLSGDQFEVFLNGLSKGLTSTPVNDGSSAVDYDIAFSSSSFSHGSYVLTSGNYVLTAAVTLSPYGGGGGGVELISSGAVPEPATWAMMIGGMGVVGGAMRRRRVSTKVSFA
ncbi:FxDxF family PEP-CTERM protein [Microvirga sp. SRT01]|uniref:FxDxF family PEP-CTERM protein n=1 Tax=Sphingomonas longa TaxID=2778730 RepID=A0ABS2D835_9SPHN|nr:MULTISPECIES: FxDxF family PEP-CTERM protein [Alphaproteobacteria]MBM6577102.1 FxDxF family PEP-CTERM protein [Sphingomonas sp. BT552]MBR7710146.1 FxDxF family PEP-CTERM protein [Microvirga sp. SRT01]